MVRADIANLVPGHAGSQIFPIDLVEDQHQAGEDNGRTGHRRGYNYHPGREVDKQRGDDKQDQKDQTDDEQEPIRIDANGRE